MLTRGRVWFSYGFSRCLTSLGLQLKYFQFYLVFRPVLPVDRYSCEFSGCRRISTIKHFELLRIRIRYLERYWRFSNILINWKYFQGTVDWVKCRLRAKLPRSIELEVFDSSKIPRTFVRLSRHRVVFELLESHENFVNFGKFGRLNGHLNFHELEKRRVVDFGN